MSDDLSGATAAAAVDEGPKKVMAVIGTTGTGKSSLCNTFAGKAHDDDEFPVGNKPKHPNERDLDKLLATPTFRMVNTDAMKKTFLATGAPAPTPCTDKTTVKTVYWKGNVERPVHLIDTPGMIIEDLGADLNDQPTGNLRAQMVKCLEEVGHVNVVLVVIDGSSPQLDGSLFDILRAFKELFGERFLEYNGVLAVTNWPRADRTEGGISDEFNTFLKEGRLIDGNPDTGHLANVVPVVFIDALYNPADEEQKEKLDEQMTILWDKLSYNPDLPVRRENSNSMYS